MQQKKIIGNNQLFYVPTSRLKQNQYSQNFIKLFKSALTKANSTTHKYHLHTNPKLHHRQKTIQEISLPKTCQKNRHSRVFTQHNPQSPANLQSHRRSLLLQLNKSKNINKIFQQQNQFFSKRCHTLETKEIQNHSVDMQQNIMMRKSGYKAPVKIRHAYTVNNTHKDNSLEQKGKQSPKKYRFVDKVKTLPPLIPTPAVKINQLIDWQIVDNYRQLEVQFRSNQYLSIPIKISTIQSKDNNYDSLNFYPHQSSKISKLTKDSIIRSKIKKLKYSLEGMSRKNKLMYLNIEQVQKFNKNLNYLMQEEQILRQIWKEKQNKTNNCQDQECLRQYKKIKQKLSKKQPLDQYFKPWQDTIEKEKQNLRFRQTDLLFRKATLSDKKSRLLLQNQNQ